MKSITSKVLTALVAGVVAVSSASAQQLTYRTCYSFSNTLDASCLSATPATQTFGNATNGATLTFIGQPQIQVTAPTNLDFGTVELSGVTGSFTFGGTPIYMQIVQINPTAGTATVTGSIAGSVMLGATNSISSNSSITWGNNRVVSIGGVQYTVENNTPIPSTGLQTDRGSTA